MPKKPDTVTLDRATYDHLRTRNAGRKPDPDAMYRNGKTLHLWVPATLHADMTEVAAGRGVSLAQHVREVLESDMRRRR